jgi:hypothetical protein
MANKSTAITDPDYQARLEEAYQKLVESLDERKNRVFDPTWMAAAQAFATPSKTGSAFEAIGRVAGAVGKSQDEEYKRNIEENKARFDINKELLAIEQQRKNQTEGLAAIRGEAPTPPTTAPEPVGALPGPQPAGGALTSPTIPKPTTEITQTPLTVEPQGGGLPPLNAARVSGAAEPAPQMVSPPALPATPAAPTAPLSAPPQAQVSPAQEKLILGMTPAGQKIAELAFRQGVPIQDAIKKGQDHDAAIQKRQIDARDIEVKEAKLKVDQGQLADAVNKTKQGNLVKTEDGIVDISSGTPRLVLTRGGNSIIFNGKTYPTDPATASEFNNAVLNKDSEKVGAIFANLTNATGKPGAPTVLSTEEREQKKAQELADIETKKQVKVEQLKAEQKRQEELVSKIPALKEQKNDTKTLIDIFNKKDVQKVLGPTAKPGVKAAIGEVVSGGLNVGGYQVAIANFDKAIVNIDAPQGVIDQLNVAGSLLRKAELLNAKTYLKGEGTVTNMERAIVQDINGLVYKDPPNALLFKSQLAYAQANMNERYIKTFQSWRDKNPEGTIEQFNRSKAYDTIESDYSDELKKIKKSIGVGPMPTEKPKDEAALTAVRNKLQGYANKVVQ